MDTVYFRFFQILKAYLFCLWSDSESPASQHLRKCHHTPSEMTSLKCIPKILPPISSTSTQKCWDFLRISSIFTSQKICDLCEHIICFYVSFSTLTLTKCTAQTSFYTLTQIEIWSQSWASGEKKNRQQSEASCCSVL